ncbi:MULTISPECIES: acyltransferase [Burkholderia]|uniref:Peptidoglycan/LPS O-acetylase OafA/YrhL n=1 Tax=Burkholderia pyrrocinia TaxID=60550 RepID=A0A318IXS0_BURPY|nr:MULTISPECIES: acyltransferase [Burkholderia]PXX39320.1 peptidoglycan/LPS O-acetylase OafA/YrhL [Burkholderia pyrrocinia]SFW19143.1 Peptidoglycan/LPS O-acetylase OafA/YrhL, contains acyltransferase and SGNH-hydrolase domains [Burkholderia sp. NFACC33-1]SFX15646.1 Peptidoglycan/LPS O-acetylase OafA/YrhL, contains acyltransferase and SGNH-hydrolase domains [Burkholderia sp. NFPP32]
MVRQQDNFEAVRLLAALTVLYGHAHALTGVASPAVFGSSAQAMAVKVFFVVSGFLVSQSWIRDPSFVRYMARRCLRIFPGLCVVILATIFVVGPLITIVPKFEYWSSADTWRYLTNIALEPNYMLPGVFLKNTYPIAVNGSLWSLPVEFFMYLLFPIVAATRNFRVLSVSIAALVLCAASVYLIRFGAGPQRIVVYGTNVISGLDVAPYFLIGAIWQICIPPKFLKAEVAVFALLMCTVVPNHPAIQEITMFVVLPYAVLSFATTKPASFGWMGRFGDFSYGIYIYGFLVEQLVSSYFGTGGRPILNFLLSLVPTIGLAVLSWHYIEKPFLRFKPKTPKLDTDYELSAG